MIGTEIALGMMVRVGSPWDSTSRRMGKIVKRPADGAYKDWFWVEGPNLTAGWYHRYQIDVPAEKAQP
jgi:hypothetical protein